MLIKPLLTSWIDEILNDSSLIWLLKRRQKIATHLQQITHNWRIQFAVSRTNKVYWILTDCRQISLILLSEFKRPNWLRFTVKPSENLWFFEYFKRNRSIQFPQICWILKTKFRNNSSGKRLDNAKWVINESKIILCPIQWRI